MIIIQKYNVNRFKKHLGCLLFQSVCFEYTNSNTTNFNKKNFKQIDIDRETSLGPSQNNSILYFKCHATTSFNNKNL